MVETILSWIDKKNGRYINVGEILFRLLLDDKINCYITANEWSYVCEGSNIKTIDEYSRIVEELYENRKKNVLYPLKKADVLLGGFAEGWKVLKKEIYNGEKRFFLSDISRKIFRRTTIFQTVLSNLYLVEDGVNKDMTESTFEIRGDASNLIIFGTPGCGKSYYVDNELLKSFNKENIFRTTFYQDYSNTDFVGQLLPYVETNENGEKNVTYEFNPGPFALALKQAVLHKDEKVALVVEELNRGNAPAIFGDVFQLLDRDENGISRYEVTNINLRDYLNRELDANFDKIKIPGNLYIYATMNTSDQNVFTLDTAFKRRWESLKLKNTFDTYIDALGYEHKHDYKSYKVPGLQDVTWQQFVDTINKAIEGVEGERDSSINVSDKKLGVYFIDKNGLYQEELQLEDLNDTSKAEKFAYKVFSYLWDDVAKFDKDKLFAKGIITLDDLIAKYIKHEIIFNPSLQEKLYPSANQKDSDLSETK